ncbi:hypothetical protein F4778DRAFT_613667 [Xylariomycetidae sp. FL2044]|nr:hypothetical protein F4778DRAFT_613667 [Xylariomycetidae sp. FL2044]
MDSTVFPAAVSPKVPVLTKNALRLVNGIDNGDSYEELFEHVQNMSKDFCLKQKFIDCQKTSEAFEDGSEDQFQLRLLFHTIPRKTLRSLVMGLLSYDYESDTRNRDNIYSPDGAGTYLVGITIRDRGGAFLTKPEIRQLLAILESYKTACEAWQKLDDEDSYSQNRLLDEEEESLNLAMEVDNKLRNLSRSGSPWESGDQYVKPMCWSGRRGVSNLEAFIRLLTQRMGFDNDDEYQLTCPQYIGCSHRVKKRVMDHDSLYSSGLNHSSSMLKLLLACLMQMELKPKVAGIPVVMVWDESQIHLSEILVHVLTMSLVSLKGLNIIQPGTSAIPEEGEAARDLYEDTKKEIWAKRPFFRENVELSLDTNVARELSGDIGRMTSLPRLRQVMDECAKLKEDMDQAVSDFHESHGEVETMLREAENLFEEADAAIDMAQGLFPS